MSLKNMNQARSLKNCFATICRALNRLKFHKYYSNTPNILDYKITYLFEKHIFVIIYKNLDIYKFITLLRSMNCILMIEYITRFKPN